MIKQLTYSLFLLGLIYGCSSSKDLAKRTPKEKGVKTEALSEEELVKFKFFFFNANKEKALGNYQEALNYYKRCTEINPKEAAPYYEISNILDLSSDSKSALSFAKKAVELDPDNYWYRVVYAHSLQKIGDIENAMKQYEYMIDTYPNEIELYYEIAGMQLYSGKYQEAIKSYNAVEKKMGITEEVSLQKQKVYIKLNDIESAANEIKALIKEYPNEIKFKGYLADLYMANNMEEEALSTYRKMLEEDPNNSFTHLSLYEYYRSKDNKEKAFEHAQIAFADKNLAIDIKMKILLSYFTLSETDAQLKKEAFELNKTLIKAHPEEAKAYTIYADFLYREKKLEGARDNYLKAIAYDSSRFAIWQQLLLIESELLDYTGMERDSKTAIDLFPNQPIFYFFYSACKLQKKEYEEAIEYLVLGKDFILGNDPLLAQFYANLGDAYYNIKDYQESYASYDKALEIEPKNVYVLNNYSYYLSLRGEKLELAEKMSLSTNEIEPDQASYEDTYAWVLYKQGKFIQAKEWLEKALTHGGDEHTAILEHYGDVHAQLKNMEKALEYWKKAKDIGEGSEFLDKKIAEKKLYE